MATLDRDDIQLSYTDHGGSGRPVVLVHGWPLSGESWSDTVPALLGAGHRVVTYDRRGFGASGMTDVGGYDYDVLTSDLAALLDELDLHDVTLVGFSMGGGEVVRFVGNHGESRLRAVVLIGAIPPWLLKSEDNPKGGLDMASARGMQDALREDREGFLDGFLTNFFTADGELMVTEDQRQRALGLAAQADLDAAVACIVLWTQQLQRRRRPDHGPDARHPWRQRRDRAVRGLRPTGARAGRRQRARPPRARSARRHRQPRRRSQSRAAGVPRRLRRNLAARERPSPDSYANRDTSPAPSRTTCG